MSWSFFGQGRYEVNETKVKGFARIMGVLFGCFSRKIDGFRFLVCLVVFSHLPGQPIYFQPERTPMARISLKACGAWPAAQNWSRPSLRRLESRRAQVARARQPGGAACPWPGRHGKGSRRLRGSFLGWGIPCLGSPKLLLHKRMSIDIIYYVYIYIYIRIYIYIYEQLSKLALSRICIRRTFASNKSENLYASEF